jgi:hypothetical protein
LLYTNHWPWANWLVVRLLNRTNQLRYAVYAAKQVLGIYETRYPRDLRPRRAIQAATRCLRNDIPANRKAAYDAAAAACAAATYTASAAAYYAADAASAAACAAADAACAAADAACAAATAADAADGKKELRQKILAYGLRLLRRQR